MCEAGNSRAHVARLFSLLAQSQFLVTFEILARARRIIDLKHGKYFKQSMAFCCSNYNKERDNHRSSKKLRVLILSRQGYRFCGTVFFYGHLLVRNHLIHNHHKTSDH